MLRRIVVVRYTLLLSSQPTSLILISLFSSLHELMRFYSPECLPYGGNPKTFPLTSLIMRLQHLTSVCRVWMANANSCISQLTSSLSVFLKGQAAFSVRRAAFSLRQSECYHVMMIHLCITTLFFFFFSFPRSHGCSGGQLLLWL